MSIKTDVRLVKYKWNELYKDEETLINVLKNIDVEDYIRKGYKGYEYVRSFNKRLNDNVELSPKQVTQLKRLAREIYMYQYDL